MKLEELLGMALIGGALWYWLKTKTTSAAPGRVAGSSSTVTGQIPGSTGDPLFDAIFGGSTNTPASSGGGLFAPPMGKGTINFGPGMDDQSASASPFVYINTSAGFGPNCSTHLNDGKPLCA